MNFLAPLAFASAAILGPFIALYMLRTRRKNVDVPSTMLWEQAGVPVSSAVPWQRLTRSPLFWLQLFTLLLLAIALAQPFTTEPSLLGPHTVLVVDTSGSMAMGSRWSDAMEAAQDLASNVSETNLVSVVEAGAVPRVLVAFSRDPIAVQNALDTMTPTGGTERLEEAIRLARGLATPDRPSSLVILSDGGLEATSQEPLLAATHLRFDNLADNVGISALTTESSTEGSLRVFLEVANWSETATDVQVEVAINNIVAVFVPFELEPLARGRATVPVDAGPGDRITAELFDNADGNPLDDAAVADVPTPSETTVQLLGEGSVFLDAMIKALPTFLPTTESPGDIQIMDGTVDGVFARPTWIIAPETPPPGIELLGTVQNAVVTFQQPGEPLLDGLDMSELVVGEAQIVDAPAWFPIVSAGDVPLILLGEVNGHRSIYTTFDLTQSNFPVLVSFPIFSSRALEFLGVSSTPTVSVESSGTPIPLVAPPDHVAQITTPNGTALILPLGASLFLDTGAPGVYEVSYVAEDGTSQPGPIAIRAFDPAESGGPFRDIAVVAGEVGQADRSALITEWAAWFLATILVLLSLEWWVGHRRPRARKVSLV